MCFILCVQVQLNFQENQQLGVELPVLGQAEGVMQNEFLSAMNATNTYMIVLADKNLDGLQIQKHQ
jgi:hypothetical protein